ncbi:2OG-Fe(II) oxygenase [Streptomyces sp. LN699]|uniref:2OG-Fe(II) oxygenase n=1 Tax=Streptomyces sp. LN699 TaxID=3112981 RepID=UPI003713ABC4
MGHGARKQLAELLGDAQQGGDFSTRIEMSARALSIVVDGVGELPLPLRAPVTKKLIAQARWASFGRGEQTLSDTSVRDTWEVTPDRITLGGTDWDRTLDGVLDGVRTALGLPPTVVLRAEPHALLVYGKGQFFLPHQDSEKDDSMVGTLVVSLPSHHTGGELVVSHAGRSVVHQASREKLTFAAFYADCLHEVKPVKSGYRVTLTMNLLAERIRPAGEDDGEPVADLAQCLTQHFTEPAEERYAYGRRKAAPPNRLVYLLDHEYTQRGLDWDRLKGADATRTALLRQAAAETGCEAVLALAEVKETWDAHAPYDRYDYYGEVEHYDDCEDEECGGECLLDPDGEPGAERRRSGDFSSYELNELIDDEITLSWWTRPDGTGGEQINLPVAYAEVCATTENKDLTPYQSEYEGYMGNYGNTLDRWYRRAAMVLWPRQRSFTARAEAGSEGALRELQGHLDAGDLDRARTLAQSLAPFWKHHGSDEAAAALFAAALPLAVGLREADPATMLLAPFGVEALGERHAPGLAAAAARYGRTWAAGPSAAGSARLARTPGPAARRGSNRCPACAPRCGPSTATGTRWPRRWPRVPGKQSSSSSPAGSAPAARRSAAPAWRGSAHHWPASFRRQDPRPPTPSPPRYAVCRTPPWNACSPPCEPRPASRRPYATAHPPPALSRPSPTTARTGSPQPSPALYARPTTGPSPRSGHAGLAADSAPTWTPSSPPVPATSWSGRSRRTDAATSTAASTRPACPSPTPPGARDVPTFWS